jgi:hypothetical protein
MKKAVLPAFLMALSIVALAQIPESFNYQVVVRDGSSNNPLANQDVSFKMSILKGSSSGESQYSELHSANTGALGIVNLIIGNGTGKTGNITTIDWGADTYFLKVEIDPDGGTSYVEMGTTQLLSVPYALHAKSAEAITPHYVGETYGGGVVFYVYDNGQHGLIAATSDQSAGVSWNNLINRLTGSTGDGINAGAMNTTMITSILISINQTGDFAAKVCVDYSVTMDGITYGDWYLPSKYELNLLYLQRDEVGGFSDELYWSSTEYPGGSLAWYSDFSTGYQWEDSKDNSLHVRAIRSF